MSEPHFIKAKVLPCLLMLCVWEMGYGVVYASQPVLHDGRVSMQGSIIGTPCTIATADLEQAIDMNVTTLGDVIDNGQGEPSHFSLTLVNCFLNDADSNAGYFRTTFDGPAEDGLFRISGAQGVGLQITDMDGNIALPGKALPAGKLTGDSQRLDYTLRLVGNHSSLNLGAYSSVIRFKVDYF